MKHPSKVNRVKKSHATVSLNRGRIWYDAYFDTEIPMDYEKKTLKGKL